MMNLQSWPILVLAVLLAVTFLLMACTAASPVNTPTPDVPEFAGGEAVAVVKTWLSGVTYEIERYERNCAKATPIPGRLTRLGGGGGLMVCESVFAGTVQGNCLSIYRDFKWNSAYLGDGVWAVTAQKDEHRSEWRVFEGTLAVDSVAAIAGCGGVMKLR
jgi:hypothetical protein